MSLCEDSSKSNAQIIGIVMKIKEVDIESSRTTRAIQRDLSQKPINEYTNK